MRQVLRPDSCHLLEPAGHCLWWVLRPSRRLIRSVIKPAQRRNGVAVFEAIETFEVYSSPDSIGPELLYEGTNSARFALMATLGARPLRDGVTRVNGSRSDVFARFGLNPELSIRAAEGESIEREYGEAQSIIGTYGPSWHPEEARFRAWSDLNEGGDIQARLAVLAAGLSSTLERESATAATAILTSVTKVLAQPESGWGGWSGRFVDRRIDTFRLGGPADGLYAPPDVDGEPEVTSPWSGEAWERYATYWLRDAIGAGDPLGVLSALRFLAHVRVDIGRRSADPIVRELAFASYLQFSDEIPSSPPPARAKMLTNAQERISTMVHGTWGWKGDWWYNGGDFHSFIQSAYRSSLYRGGQEFSWSGAYSRRQRATGGERFKRWADSAGGDGGVETVFAHSYGGEIVARAVNAGALVDEVVLLSAPVHAHHRQMLSRVRRVVDVRLSFDIVLTAAGADQKLPGAPNVVEYIVDQPFWSHSATHDPALWEKEGIAADIGL